MRAGCLCDSTKLNVFLLFFYFLLEILQFLKLFLEILLRLPGMVEWLLNRMFYNFESFVELDFIVPLSACLSIRDKCSFCHFRQSFLPDSVNHRLRGTKDELLLPRLHSPTRRLLRILIHSYNN